ncbi:uncharacterized protein LTR77_001461 [Saxophila tyrrhenica]|uniref:NAD(P)-binding protein n=1 Tax=Saxophila tyrrhenica TaxID=1690608 RepID=A0AAV9PNC1_9PEZI|nr:hypothetical protein LTR77_001461 [Saxophila tyrrhenica]
MASTSLTAIITGGASGMGLAVAEALSKRGNWNVHLFDMNVESGNKAAEQLGAAFHQVNVTEYSSLAGAFKDVFKTTRRLDFVHANAGIMERGDFYKAYDTGDEPPPPFSPIVIDINTTAVINTSYLAQHYFRQTSNDGRGPRSLVVTASCGGLYAVPASPVYGSSKFAALGWTRNIAGPMWENDGVRVNAICPGAVRTNLLAADAWKNFPQDNFVPMEKIVEAVLMLLDGDGKQANGASSGKPLVGQTVELSGTKYYFRQQSEYCDEGMAATMGSNGVQG